MVTPWSAHLTTLSFTLTLSSDDIERYTAQVGCLVYKCCASNYSSSCKKTCTCPMSLGVKYSNWSTDIMFLVAAGSSQALFFLVFLWLGPCRSHWTLDLFCFACRWSWGSLLCILVHFLACHPGHYLLWGMVELELLLFIHEGMLAIANVILFLVKCGCYRVVSIMSTSCYVTFLGKRWFIMHWCGWCGCCSALNIWWLKSLAVSDGPIYEQWYWGETNPIKVDRLE